MFNYARLTQVHKDLINNFGLQCTLHSRVKSGSAGDPTYTDTDYVVTAVRINAMNKRDIAVSREISFDVIFYVHSVNEPKPADHLTFDGDKSKFVKVERIAPADKTIGYKCYAKR